MKIIFSLSATYTINSRFEKDSFSVSPDTVTFIPSLNRLDVSREEINNFYDDWKSLYNALCQKWHDWNSLQYKFNYQTHDIYNAIIDKIGLICSKIEGLNIKSSILNNFEYKIPLHLLGNKYVWEVFMSLLGSSNEIITLDPKEANYQKGILHRIPYIEERVKEINQNLKNNEICFEVSGVFSRTGSVRTSKNYYEWINLLPEIEKTNNIIDKIMKTLSSQSNITSENFSKYYQLKIWLDLKLWNVINFLTISKRIIDEVQNPNLKNSDLFSSFNSYCHIWCSFLYELIKPYGKGKTISTLIIDLKNDPQLAHLLKEIDFFNFNKVQQFKIENNKKITTGQKNEFCNKELNNFLKIIGKDRLKTFHLNQGAYDDSIENEYNLSFLSSYFWWEYNDAKDSVNNFILKTKDLILNSFFLVWKTFNYLCGNTILAPSEVMKKRLNNIFEKK